MSVNFTLSYYSIPAKMLAHAQQLKLTHVSILACDASEMALC